MLVCNARNGTLLDIVRCKVPVICDLDSGCGLVCNANVCDATSLAIWVEWMRTTEPRILWTLEAGGWEGRRKVQPCGGKKGIVSMREAQKSSHLQVFC